MRNVQARIAELADTADGDEYVAAYYDLKKYHDLVERHTEDTAGILGYSLFQTEGNCDQGPARAPVGDLPPRQGHRVDSSTRSRHDTSCTRLCRR